MTVLQRRRTVHSAAKLMSRKRKPLHKRRVKPVRKKGAGTRRYVIPPIREEIHPNNPLLSVIIPAMNEEKTIGRVVRQALRICKNSEVIAVVNGSTDGTAAAAQAAGARVLLYTEALGHDAGRRMGAAAARGRILLFTDADIPIPAEQLAPYVQAILDGTDVALNDYDGPVKRNPVHPVVEAKHVLNSILARPDLQGASMTAIPHALSRRALDVIGVPSLEVPPLALAKAVSSGLEVRAVHHVPVGKMNAVRVKRRSGPDPLSQVVLNDHLTAIRWITDELGPRGGYSDLQRVRCLTR
ncbi:glycosyltransferase family 2 protein [Paenibacillus illinoisensis]|uniref:glycosyltransferase family 2 protein n=1 Tax=Paenibacillus illinoisensis TaxID=59845 RepID=UPI0036F33EA0